MTPAVDISRLEARLAALEEKEAVLAVLHAYSKTIDSGDRDAWIECFTPDGAFDVRSDLPGYPAQRHEGTAALRAFIEGHSAPPAVHHKHLYLVPELGIDGASASASGYFVHLVDRDHRPVIVSYGRYLDTLRKGDDGRWRISERVAAVEASEDSGRDSMA